MFKRSLFRSSLRLLVAPLLLCFCASPLNADPLDELAGEFWQWRAIEQPLSSDDVTRVQRPLGWKPDWSPEAVGRYHQQLERFESRWKTMDPSVWPVSRQVDYRLIGSALARIRWELDLNRSWQKDPGFYVDQSVGAYFQLLLPPPPFTADRTQQIVATLASIPSTLRNGESNLSEPVAPFARSAIDQLENIGPRLRQSVHELTPGLAPGVDLRALDQATEQAAAALESYRGWLERRLPAMSGATAIGRQQYLFFLQRVALLPFSPEQILAMGREEWARSVASQSYEEHRNHGVPQLQLFRDQAEQVAEGAKDELAIRLYLEQKALLTVPPATPHFRLLAMPAYLAPISSFGEADDFTSRERSGEPGIRYVDPPSPRLGYFAFALAEDPRCQIVHEGMPGHFFQLITSWANSDPIRRHYYDSGANEGIGFYAEEMMLHAGLFDDSPRTREIIWNFMRLRALRVEVDVRLALGDFTIEQAAQYLEATVPMDSATAHGEAAFFASTPGQAISYQIGKLEIYRFLADAERKQGANFNLQAFQDYLWQNGNLPIILQRWEYLGTNSEMDELANLH
jgi:hypothetical protein